ncbi:MAG: H-X9-DG-CTERM domain-containing protein [Bacteroidota bacterium]
MAKYRISASRHPGGCNWLLSKVR